MNTTAITSTDRHEGDTAFKVRDGAALYTFRTITAEQADDLGCPGANTILIGRHGHIVGQATPVTGRVVKVSPSWGYRFGTLTRFVSWGGAEVLFGYVGAIGGER